MSLQTQKDTTNAMETETIWRDFHSRLLSFINSRIAPANDAEDILQEVFTRIHANRHQLAELQSVSGWVYRITRNALADHHRSRARNADAMQRFANDLKNNDEASQVQDETIDRASASSNDELAQCMKPLIDGLPKPYAEAVAMTEIGSLSQKQAALQARVTVSGMKSRVQRGREKLKKSLFDRCTFELDRRSGVIDFEPNGKGGCGSCDCT